MGPHKDLWHLTFAQLFLQSPPTDSVNLQFGSACLDFPFPRNQMISPLHFFLFQIGKVFHPSQDVHVQPTIYFNQTIESVRLISKFHGMQLNVFN